MLPKIKPLFLLNIIVVYVILQLVWWAWLLLSQYGEIYSLRLSMNTLQEIDHASWLIRKRQMIIGEGLVFLILLALGIYYTRRSFKQEEKLNNRQNNFLLSITHELKSPLASVKLQLETLLKHEINKDQQNLILKAAISDGNRLNLLVENILLATRIEQSGLILHKEKTDLSDLIHKSIRPLTSLYPGHLINFEGLGNLTINCDQLAMQSILNNLIENAVKYSDEGKSVIINAISSNSFIKITIEDNGWGIPDSEKKFVFEKFYRSGSEETRRTKGTGLGLYIVKQLVILHKGEINIIDRKEGGTSFEIIIPN